MDERPKLFLEKTRSMHNKSFHVLEKLILENVLVYSLLSNDQLLEVSKRPQWNDALIILFKKLESICS